MTSKSPRCLSIHLGIERQGFLHQQSYTSSLFKGPSLTEEDYDTQAYSRLYKSLTCSYILL
jgi:hypothetical protein